MVFTCSLNGLFHNHYGVSMDVVVILVLFGAYIAMIGLRILSEG
jgi:hypothetical protein